jgi:hypothetical protein
MPILNSNSEILSRTTSEVVQGAFVGNGLNFPGVDEWVNSANSPLFDFERKQWSQFRRRSTFF